MASMCCDCSYFCVRTNTYASGRGVYIVITTKIVLVDKNVLRFHTTKKMKSTKHIYKFWMH